MTPKEVKSKMKTKDSPRVLMARAKGRVMVVKMRIGSRPESAPPESGAGRDDSIITHRSDHDCCVVKNVSEDDRRQRVDGSIVGRFNDSSAMLIQPRSPMSALKPAPTTRVGITNGMAVRARNRSRPRK